MGSKRALWEKSRVFLDSGRLLRDWKNASKSLAGWLNCSRFVYKSISIHIKIIGFHCRLKSQVQLCLKWGR
jgi:hypothetical protein